MSPFRKPPTTEDLQAINAANLADAEAAHGIINRQRALADLRADLDRQFLKSPSPALMQKIIETQGEMDAAKRNFDQANRDLHEAIFAAISDRSRKPAKLELENRIKSLPKSKVTLADSINELARLSIIDGSRKAELLERLDTTISQTLRHDETTLGRLDAMTGQELLKLVGSLVTM